MQEARAWKTNLATGWPTRLLTKGLGVEMLGGDISAEAPKMIGDKGRLQPDKKTDSQDSPSKISSSTIRLLTLKSVVRIASGTK